MPKMKLRVKAVIFDMDGVITNTMPDHYQAWRTVLHEEGVLVTYHDVYSREGQQGLQSLREIASFHGKVFNGGWALKVLQKKEQLFKTIVRTRFILGSRSFLKGLNRQGFLLALVTGTSRHELHKILPDAVYDLFSASVTGDEVVKGKPDPEPYLKSLREMRISPDDAVVIENAPLGIASAKAAGLRCLGLETSLSRDYLKEADAVFRTIHELRSNVTFLRME